MDSVRERGMMTSGKHRHRGRIQASRHPSWSHDMERASVPDTRNSGSRSRPRTQRTVQRSEGSHGPWCRQTGGCPLSFLPEQTSCLDWTCGAGVLKTPCAPDVCVLQTPSRYRDRESKHTHVPRQGDISQGAHRRPSPGNREFTIAVVRTLETGYHSHLRPR